MCAATKRLCESVPLRGWQHGSSADGWVLAIPGIQPVERQIPAPTLKRSRFLLKRFPNSRGSLNQAVRSPEQPPSWSLHNLHDTASVGFDNRDFATGGEIFVVPPFRDFRPQSERNLLQLDAGRHNGAEFQRELHRHDRHMLGSNILPDRRAVLWRDGQ